MSCPLASLCVTNPRNGRTIKRLESQELVDAHRERMQHEEAKKLLRDRNAIVERSIGDVKEHRDGRRLHGRGLGRATAEIGLKVIARNLLALRRLREKAESHSDDSPERQWAMLDEQVASKANAAPGPPLATGS